MTVDQTGNELSRTIAREIETLADQGYRLPLTVTAVSAAGSLSAWRYDWEDGQGHSGRRRSRELQITPIAEHAAVDSEDWERPINLFFADARGESHVFVLYKRGRMD